MKELDKGLEYSLEGPQAAEWTERARRQITGWGLEMPATEALVLDFGLGDFEHVGEIEFWIANEVTAGYCGKFMFLFAGQTCPRHYHKEKLETFFVVRGSISMDYADKRVTLTKGDVLTVETERYHEFSALENSLVLEVSKPSIIDDNFFENGRIPIGGNYRAGEE